MTREERVFFPVERTGPPGGRPARTDTSRSRPFLAVRAESAWPRHKHKFKQLYNVVQIVRIVQPHRFKSGADTCSPAFSLWTESAPHADSSSIQTSRKGRDISINLFVYPSPTTCPLNLLRLLPHHHGPLSPDVFGILLGYGQSIWNDGCLFLV